MPRSLLLDALSCGRTVSAAVVQGWLVRENFVGFLGTNTNPVMSSMSITAQCCYNCARSQHVHALSVCNHDSVSNCGSFCGLPPHMQGIYLWFYTISTATSCNICRSLFSFCSALVTNGLVSVVDLGLGPKSTFSDIVWTVARGCYSTVWQILPVFGARFSLSELLKYLLSTST